MWIKILLLFFVFAFLFRTDLSFDQDLGRHLKLGEIIVQTHQVPKTNLFSYTNPDFPFINTHWLFEVLVYMVNQTIGLQWMLILKIVVILISVWLILKIIPRQNTTFLLPIGFIFLHVLRERAELRPEIFSFLFTSITYFIITRFTDSIQKTHGRSNFVYQKAIFVLPMIQLIWINTHIYFFVGFLIQAIFLLHLVYQYLRFHLDGKKVKLLAMVFVLSVLFSLINPHGLAGILYPLNVTKNYGYTIVENQSMFLLESIKFRDPNFLFVKIAIILVILSVAKNIIISFTRLWRVQDDKEGAVKNILLAVSGLALALLNVRSFPYLVFLSLPATMQNFGAIPWNKLTKILTAVVGILLLFESYFYLNGDYYKYRNDQHKVGLSFEENVKGAMDFVLVNNLPGPIYNNFDIGSYVLYRGYPKYQVFIDGRPEAYPAQFFTGIYIPSQSEYKNFKEVEKIYGFKTIIFSHTDQTPWGRNFLQNVVKDESWKLVYIDDFMLLFVRADVVDNKKLTTIDLAKLNPNSFQFDSHVSYLRLGLFLLSTGYTDSGRQFIVKTLQVFPDSPTANYLIGNHFPNKFFW